jgi:DNA-binding GntR family transcriptional regulator
MKLQTSKFNLPSRKSLWQQVHDVLENMIIHREIAPGEKLIEQNLSDYFGVSRGPIREAILALQKDGWVDVQHNYGAFVKNPGRKEAAQLFEVRRILEAEAAVMAAKRITENQLEQLKAIIDKGIEAQASKDVDGSLALNTQFHRLVCEASGNEVLARLMEHVEKQVVWFLSAVVSFRGDVSWVEHESIFEALSSGNDQLAGDLMSKHAQGTFLAYLSTNDDQVAKSADIESEAQDASESR